MNSIEGPDRSFLCEHVRCCCVAEIDSDRPQIATAVKVLIQDSVDSGRDWKAELAIELVDKFVKTSLKSQIWSSPQDSDSPSRLTLVHAMNLALTQMVGPASLACEIAQNIDGSTQSRDVSSFESSTRLRPTYHNGEPTYTMADILTSLTAVLLRALEARDDYRYDDLVKVLDEVDEMPMEFKSDRFVVFGCLRIVAQAGESRTKKPELIRESIHIDIWEKLAKRISEDSALVHESDDEAELRQCTAYPMLILVSGIGHMRREHAAALVPELVALVFTELDQLAGCWSEVRSSDVVKATEHHIRYYRYFAFHVLAIAIATRYPDSKWINSFEDLLKDRLGDVMLSEWHDIASDAYRRATVSIESALSLVPATNGARRDYYDLTAENLEHEMSLRLQLLEQKVNMDDTVEEFAVRHVTVAVGCAKKDFQKDLDEKTDKLQDEVRNISIRVVEIIGIFLAIVAFLGTTVVSGTAGELPMEQRILILVIGGAISLLFFVLLRWAVFKPISSTDGSNKDKGKTTGRRQQAD